MDGKGSTASCSSGNNKAENTGEFCDDSPPKKMKASCVISAPEDGAGGFKAAWSDAVRDINLLFTKFSEVLRERAALDASQIQELTNILNEAMSLESELREKKEQLRQALAMISDKLQG